MWPVVTGRSEKFEIQQKVTMTNDSCQVARWLSHDERWFQDVYFQSTPTFNLAVGTNTWCIILYTSCLNLMFITVCLTQNSHQLHILTANAILGVWPGFKCAINASVEQMFARWQYEPATNYSLVSSSEQSVNVAPNTISINQSIKLP